LDKEKNEIKKLVTTEYGKIAREELVCCEGLSSCCGGHNSAESISKGIGYTDKDLESVPKDSNLGLGCGNPIALASLNEGETVLDLGSGAGFDCFLAANKIGNNGRVIGVDMTSEMIEKARENARKGGYKNVEFRLGEIENIPAADGSVDVVISNCVINLSPDKKRVFEEAYRVLRLGGRLMISDIVLLKDLPKSILNSVEAYVGCISGAMLKDEYLGVVRSGGFKEIKIIDIVKFPINYLGNDPSIKAVMSSLKITPEDMKDIASSVVSIKLQAKK
jgi:SAM-dependent methyltransferase